MHLLWKEESLLTHGYESAEACFLAQGDAMAIHARDSEFADDIGAACTCLRAIDSKMGGESGRWGVLGLLTAHWMTLLGIRWQRDSRHVILRPTIEMTIWIKGISRARP